MDSLFCGKATVVAVRLQRPAKSRLSNPSSDRKRATPDRVTRFLVEEDGFEPSKAKPADLQSVPFGHLGTPPYSVGEGGAGGRIRTPDLLITNQLLYQLSYTSTDGTRVHNDDYYNSRGEVCQLFFQKITKLGPGPGGSWTDTAGRSIGAARELRCSLCRGELYPGDTYFELDGRTVCEDCLGRYARIYFAHRLRRVAWRKKERE